MISTGENRVVKLVILYKHPKNETLFEQGYTTNLALLEKMPHIIRRQANMVRGGPGGRASYYRVLEFYFDNNELLEQAMTSPEGVAAGQDLMEYAGNIVELLFVDVYEDSTPPSQN